MKSPRCNECKHWAESVDRPDWQSAGECRRYPVVKREVSRIYWCGEFKRRRIALTREAKT